MKCVECPYTLNCATWMSIGNRITGCDCDGVDYFGYGSEEYYPDEEEQIELTSDNHI